MKRIASLIIMLLMIVRASAHEEESQNNIAPNDTVALAADTTAEAYIFPTENHLNFSILGINNEPDSGVPSAGAPMSIDGGTGLYLGFGSMLNTPSGVRSKWWESTEIDFICAYLQTRLSRRDALSFGGGFTWHFFNLSDGNRFVQNDEGQLTIEPMPEGCNPGNSRIVTFGACVPLRYTHQFATNKSLLIGPIVECYVYSRIRTDYKLDGKKQKESAKNLHLNNLNLNFMAQYNMKYCGLFCRYAPFSVVDKNFGPDLGYLSFGVVLFPSF